VAQQLQDAQVSVGRGGAPVIRLRNVCKAYLVGDGEVKALDQIDLTVPRDAFVSLIGPSGCGKSTILKLITGLTRCTEGSIEFRGRPVTGINT